MYPHHPVLIMTVPDSWRLPGLCVLLSRSSGLLGFNDLAFMCLFFTITVADGLGLRGCPVDVGFGITVRGLGFGV